MMLFCTTNFQFVLPETLCYQKNFIYMIGIVLITSATLAGCTEPNERENVPMFPIALRIQSISQDRPAEVVIAMFGIYRNSCVHPDAKVSPERVDNTIQLDPMMSISTGPVDCSDILTEVYGEVTVSDLEVGEYTIVIHDAEIGQLRIQEEAAYVVFGPIIDQIYTYYKTPDGDELYRRSGDRYPANTTDPVRVTLRVSGIFDMTCVSYLKTEIQRRAKEVYVNITAEVPIGNTQCELDLLSYGWDWNGGRFTDPSRYNAGIDIGTFTAGSYQGYVNGEHFSFEIRLAEE